MTSPFRKIAKGLRRLLGPSVDDIVETLPSVLSYAEKKRSLIIFRELEGILGGGLSLGAVHLALEKAVSEGWADAETSVSVELGREIVSYYKVGSGRRIKKERPSGDLVPSGLVGGRA